MSIISPTSRISRSYGLRVACACHRLTEEREKSQSLAVSNARLLGELESYKRHVALIESHSNSWREHATHVIQSGLIDHRHAPQPATHTDRAHSHCSASSQGSTVTHACTPQPPPMMWGVGQLPTSPMMGHPAMMGYMNMPHTMQYNGTPSPYHMHCMQGVPGSTKSSNSVSDVS